MANPRIDELRRRLEKEPQSRLFAQLAEELRKDGELGDAIRVAREGLEKHPAYVSARMTLGRALQDSGEIAGARSEFEAVLATAPDNILASRLLAQCLEGLGSIDAALARYRATLALSPGDPQMMARVASLELRASSASPPGAGAALPSRSAAGGPGRPPAQGTGAGLVQNQAGTPTSGPGTDSPEGGAGPSPGTAGEWTGEEFGSPGAAPPFAAAIGSQAMEQEPELVAEAAEPPDYSPLPVAVVDSEEFELEGAFEAPGMVWERELHAPPAESPELASPTLGELYFDQGHIGKAIEVYRRVVEQAPGNERAQARLMELEAFERHLRSQEVTPSRVAQEPRRTGAGASDPRPSRREAVERVIGRLEGLRTALKGARQ